MKTLTVTNSYYWNEKVEAISIEEALKADKIVNTNFLTDGRKVIHIIEHMDTFESIKIGDRIAALWHGQVCKGTVTKIAKKMFHVSDSTHGDCTTLKTKGFVGKVVLGY